MLEAQSPPIARPSLDLDRPSIARVHDYLVGGTANWAIDREFGKRVLQRFPLFREIAIANRLFLDRVVRYLARRGVRQFLDIGSGTPEPGNTTHRIAPDARVVYADNEPVAIAHAEVLLDEDGDPARHAVINADLRRPDELWRAALGTGLINPNEPLAVLMLAVLHVSQPGPDGGEINPLSVARFRDLLPRGSYLGISHITNEGVPRDFVSKLSDLKRMYDTTCRDTVVWRTRREIRDLLGDFQVVRPGMVWAPQWHPEQAAPPSPFDPPSQAVIWAGVGRKGGP